MAVVFKLSCFRKPETWAAAVLPTNAVPRPIWPHGPQADSLEDKRTHDLNRRKELKSVVHSAPGWKLFGKVPPRENLQKTSKIIQQVSTKMTVKFPRALTALLICQVRP